MNRGNARATVYHNHSDYDSFVRLIKRASDRIPLRVLAFCLMPNHFHLVLRPFEDGDLSRWMQSLLTSHVRRYHKIRGTSGRVWQGRFKAFPIQEDRHLLTVMRYVERNPVRANLVQRAADWRWSSISGGENPGWQDLVTDCPVAKPRNWEQLVDTPLNDDELKALRRCGQRDAPYGDSAWTRETARNLGLESGLRRVGRPSEP